MKYPILIALLISSILVQSQEIKQIIYRGENVLIYPDSLFNFRISQIKENLPDGNYRGFLRCDTSLLVLRVSYKNMKIEGKLTEYGLDPSNIISITNFKNGLKHGYWCEFSDDTILHEGNYINGMKEGFEYSYAGPKGSKTEYNKCFYKNDTLKYNIWYKYDSTCYVADTGYCHISNYTRKLLGYGKTYKGYKTGLWKQYFENGNLKSVGNYEIVKHSESFSESIKFGKWIDYYENGKISREYICDTSSSPLIDNVYTIICQYDTTGKIIERNSFRERKGLYQEFQKNGNLNTEIFFVNANKYKYLKNIQKMEIFIFTKSLERKE